MRRNRFGVLLGTVGLLASSAAIASEAMIVEVFQPLGDPNGIFLSAVSYLGYHGGPVPGRALFLTCKANAVPNPWGSPINLNTASIGQFKISADFQENGEMLFGDTIRVSLDVSSVDTMGVVRLGDSPDSIVVATIECLLANAAREGDRTHHVALEIKGRKALQKYGGIFRRRRTVVALGGGSWIFGNHDETIRPCPWGR